MIRSPRVCSLDANRPRDRDRGAAYLERVGPRHFPIRCSGHRRAAKARIARFQRPALAGHPRGRFLAQQCTAIVARRLRESGRRAGNPCREKAAHKHHSRFHPVTSDTRRMLELCAFSARISKPPLRETSHKCTRFGGAGFIAAHGRSTAVPVLRGRGACPRAWRFLRRWRHRRCLAARPWPSDSANPEKP